MPLSGKVSCQIGQKDFAENRMDGEASASSTKAAGFSQPHHPVGPEKTRAPCGKRTGNLVQRAEKFGDLITADHEVSQ